ncbi:MAG: ABC transporter substrate-binding protein [Brachybacterium faecium]|nr:MAG: ABC transporter substrate-binding protein [Brachybacterium faecium]
MKLDRRTLLAASGVSGAALLAACSGGGEDVDLDGGGGGSDGGGAVDGAELIAAIAGEPDQLDPHSTTAYFSFQVLENIFDTLVEPDENLEMVGALAEDWEVSDDQLTYTFTLREGVTWHDGSEFTADDVVYSYNRIIDEELANAWRLAAIESVEAPDAGTVVITVGAPTPDLLANLGNFKGLAIVKQDNVDSGDIVTSPIGTGPFKLADYVTGDSIALEANPDFWGGAPALGGVTFRFISEGSTAVTALQNSEVHWTDSFEPQRVEQIEGNDALVLGQVPSNDYWYLALNIANAPWDTVEARQGIAYAIDREAIIQASTQGTAVANQLAIPETSSWYHEYSTYSTDPDKAQELFDAAGGVDGTIIRFMATSEYPETVSSAQLIADQLSQFGITVEISTVDFATWLAEQNAGNFDMLMMGWLGNIDPSGFYYAQHHSEGANNRQSYSNPEVDRLLEEGGAEPDEARRKEIYAEAATIIADECSYIYLYNPAVLQAWVPEVEGYEARGDAAIRFRDTSLNQ